MDFKDRIISIERILNRRALKLTGGVKFQAEDLTIKVIEYLRDREAKLSLMEHEDFVIFSLSIMRVYYQLISMLPTIKSRSLKLCMGIESDAEDLTQDVITKLLFKREDLIHVENLVGYAIRATENRYIDLFRAKPNYVEPEEIDDISSQDTAQTDKAFDDIEEALSIIGANCRSLLNLTGQGFSYEEIGTKFNIVKGTVMSRMFRCRQKFHKICLE